MATLQPPPPPPKTGTAQVDNYLQSIYKWQYLLWYYATNSGMMADSLGESIQIPGMDGDPGEDGMMGPPGRDGEVGPMGMSIPGADGMDGEDAYPIPGPKGDRGEPGVSIPGMDGVDGEDAYPIPGQNQQEAYGTMYIYSLGAGATTVTVSATDTFYEIGSGVSGGATKQFTFQNNKELLCDCAGKYIASVAASIECAAANQEFECAIMVNGTANTSIAGHSETASANKPTTVSACGIVTLTVGDVVSAAVLNHTATNNLIIDHLSVTLHYAGA